MFSFFYSEDKLGHSTPTFSELVLNYMDKCTESPTHYTNRSNLDIETNAMNLPAHSFCADVNAMLEFLSYRVKKHFDAHIRMDKMMNNHFLVPKHDSYVPKYYHHCLCLTF